MSRILVVDDDPADRQLITQILEKQDLQVVAGGDGGRRSGRWLGREPLDAAILDVLLPDGDGIDLFRQIREIDATLPVMFVTASGRATRRLRRCSWVRSTIWSSRCRWPRCGRWWSGHWKCVAWSTAPW